MRLIGDEEALYEAIGERVSRRKYRGSMSKAQFDELTDFAIKCYERTEGAVKIRVFEDGGDAILNGMRNSYGLITGVKGFASFSLMGTYVDERELVGYYGEQFILKATSMGLGTCWIGGTFDKLTAAEFVQMEIEEVLCYVTPLGEVAKGMSTKEKVIKMATGSVSRLPLKTLVTNYTEVFAKSPKWIQRGVEAAQIAPSSVNKQPWRFTIDLEKQRLGVALVAESIQSQDIGIAMAHIELVGRHYGINGEWLLEKDNGIWWYGTLES